MLLRQGRPVCFHKRPEGNVIVMVVRPPSCVNRLALNNIAAVTQLIEAPSRARGKEVSNPYAYNKVCMSLDKAAVPAQSSARAWAIWAHDAPRCAVAGSLQISPRGGRGAHAVDRSTIAGDAMLWSRFGSSLNSLPRPHLAVQLTHT